MISREGVKFRFYLNTQIYVKKARRGEEELRWKKKQLLKILIKYEIKAQYVRVDEIKTGSILSNIKS